jgi:hypothetical protein
MAQVNHGVNSHSVEVPVPAVIRDAAEAAKSMRRIRLYSKIMVQDYQNKFYRKRIRPTDVK